VSADDDDKAAKAEVRRILLELAAHGRAQASTMTRDVRKRVEALVSRLVLEVQREGLEMTAEEHARAAGFVLELARCTVPVVSIASELEANALKVRGWVHDGTSNTQDRLLVVASSFMLGAARLLRLAHELN
jgi:hypothetical protein